jgi:hypothetical protein
MVYGAQGADRDCYTKACLQPRLEIISWNIQFLVDELGRLNANDALLGGRLDLERLGAFGFSWGNVGMAEFARVDSRCKAVVLLDAGPLLEAATNLNRLGLQKPFLSMNSTMMRPQIPAGYTPNWLATATNLFAKATGDAFLCQIQDSTHWSFDERGSLINDPTLTGDPTAVSRGQNIAIRACMVSFFDKYLKGEDDQLLDNPAAVYPNIINFQSK